MKKTISLLLAVCLFFSAAAVLVGVTAAWLADGLYTQRFPTDFSGSSDLAYFAGGDGTADAPYEIGSAVHLYNLAWLQYLGYFNMNPALNNGLAQSHFRLTGNIEMGTLTLPPIGTTEYPFIGVFDGNGYTVSGLTVSNREQDLRTRPANAKFNENAHLRCVDTTDAVSIVGLFGVIGNPKGTTYVDTYAAANPDFVKDTMTVGGFYANDLHIRSYTGSTLCGLIAGWVGANLSHVGVYRGDFVFATNAAGLAAFLDDGDSGTLLSKYSLVGNYDKDLVGWSALTGSGDNTDWGGSVDMKSVHTRLMGFWKSPTGYVDASFNEVRKTSSSHTWYYDAQKGSLYFNSNTSAYSNIVYLYGGLAKTYTYSGTVTTLNGGTEERNFASYFPLNVDANGIPLATNTGYIASGNTNNMGDIRVRNTPIGSALKTSLNNSAFEEGKTLELLTRTKKSGGFVRITDTYNQGHSSVSSSLSEYNAMETAALGLLAYANARKQLNDLLTQDGDKVYGMHFMKAKVGVDNVYVAPKAVINGTTYTNYEMTANSIDFRTQSRGHISFFAGTYYNNTDDNFFSLHEIFRDADNHITAVREIAKIYAKTGGGADYIYEYTDGGYSGGYTALPAGYELEFDCDWIINPTMVRYAVYYFEIPVNAGEYALGSADTGDGAYLMYLDIGANAAGTGENPGGETAYAMESVDFVNRAETGVERDGNGNAIKSSFDSYTAVVAALSDASGTPYIVFRRRDGTATDESGNVSTVLAYRAAGLTVAPTPQTAAEEDTTLSPPDDIGTA